VARLLRSAARANAAAVKDGDTVGPGEARWSTIAVLMGLAAGVFMTAAGLMTGGSRHGSGLAPGIAATVNGRELLVEDLERLAAGLAAEDRVVTLEDRQRVLDRMVDESLLLGRAVELGLVGRDPAARKALVSAVVDSVVTDSSDLDPGDEQLREFFEDNRDYFRSSPRLVVEQMFFSSGRAGLDHALRANKALARLRAGESAELVARELADRSALPLPAQPLPPAKLRDYLGPTAVRTAMGLGEGEYSEVLPGVGGSRVLRLLGRVEAAEPAFEMSRAQVLNEYRRRAGDDALRAYIDRMKRRASVEIAEDYR